MAERVSQLASRLEGHAEQIDLRAFLDELQQAHSVIYDYEYAQNIGPLIAGKQTEVSEFTALTVARGAQVSEADYASAMTSDSRVSTDFQLCCLAARCLCWRLLVRHPI